MQTITKNGRTATIQEWITRGKRTFAVKCDGFYPARYYECRTLRAAIQWAEAQLSAFDA